MPTETAKKPRLSITQIEMLARCGEAYRLRYVEGQKRPPGIAMLVGKSVDAGVNADMRAKAKTGELLPEEAVLQAARDEIDTQWGLGVALDEDEAAMGVKAVKGQAVDKSVRLARLHHRKIAPKRKPDTAEHIQRWFTVELRNYPMDLVGVIDLQEGTERMIDTKTTGKTPQADEAERTDQLTMYAMAGRVLDGKAPDELALDYLVDTKDPKALTLTTRRDDEDFRIFLRKVEVAIKLIENGIFIPAPTGAWWCAPRWCGYYPCRYIRQSKAVAVPESFQV